DVDKSTEALAFEFVEGDFDFAGGNRILGPVLEGGVGGEITNFFADGGAFTDKGKDDQVIRAGLVGSPIQRLQDLGVGGQFSLTRLIAFAQEEADVVGIDAEIVFVGKQVTQCLNVPFSVGAGQNLFILVLADAHQHHVRLRGCLGRPN